MLYSRWRKRLFDLVIASLALLLFSPVLLISAMLVRVKLGAPILFRQQRSGLNGKPFTIYKFRTMTDTFDANGQLLPDVDRLTKFGHFLRGTSLDELPELFNVLKSEMSLVGPRPLLMKYLPYYTAEERLRFEVRPGITGWAQINGRNDLAWNKRLAFDVWYVQHQSIWLDLRIIFGTLLKIVRRDNVRTDPRSVMLDLDDERR